MIPKIIHQQAPRDTSKWHDKWFACSESFFGNFWDHDYRRWDDETIDDFVKKDYPQYYETFQSFPMKILKIDFTRPLILHKYGGIYADMDYLCIRNFRDQLDQTKVNIVESPVSFLPSWQETIQNSMMASPPKCQFWLDFCDYIIEIYSKEEMREELEYSVKINRLQVSGWIVKATTGPIALSKFWRETNSDINVLPRRVFNPRVIKSDLVDGEIKLNIDDTHPKDECDVDNLYGTHLTTGKWG